MRQLLVLAHQRGGGALRHHEARIEPGIADEEGRQQRDRRIDQRGDAPLRQIEPISAMAIAIMSAAKATGSAWKLPPESTAPSSAKDQRIVAHRIGLDDQRLRAQLREKVEAGAHHLRLAAEGIGILHPVIAGQMRGADLAAGEQAAVMRRPRASGRDAAAMRECADRRACRSP